VPRIGDDAAAEGARWWPALAMLGTPSMAIETAVLPTAAAASHFLLPDSNVRALLVW
jgi:hypothetical protein